MSCMRTYDHFDLDHVFADDVFLDIILGREMVRRSGPGYQLIIGRHFQVYRMRRDGKKQCEIAAALGISKSRVRQNILSVANRVEWWRSRPDRLYQLAYVAYVQASAVAK